MSRALFKINNLYWLFHDWYRRSDRATYRPFIQARLYMEWNSFRTFSLLAVLLGYLYYYLFFYIYFFLLLESILDSIRLLSILTSDPTRRMGFLLFLHQSALQPKFWLPLSLATIYWQILCALRRDTTTTSNLYTAAFRYLVRMYLCFVGFLKNRFYTVVVHEIEANVARC